MSQATAMPPENVQQIAASFQGNSIQATRLPPSAELASIRSGDGDIMTVPWMQFKNREKFAKELAHYQEEKYDYSDPTDAAELSQVLMESYGNRELTNELAAYKTFELQNEVLASVFALGAFQQVTLGEDELPIIIKPRKRQYFHVRYMGNDGQARRDQWQDSRTMSMITMRRLTTDKVEYPLFDIQTGRIQAFQEITKQLTWDMDFKLDIDAQAQLDAGATTSGLRDLLSLHPLIIAANVPDTNYLDLRAIGVAGTLDITKIKMILAHISQWGVDGVTPDGAFTIQTIVISPQNMRDQWDFVNLVSSFAGGPYQPNNVVPDAVRQQIFSQGVMNQAWGYSWTTIPNARLPKGRMYVFSNQPVGWFFTKPQFDQTIVWDGPDFQERNEGHVVYNKVIQFAMPDLWLHRYIIVDF